MNFLSTMKKKVLTLRKVGVRKAISHKLHQYQYGMLSRLGPVELWLFNLSERWSGYAHERQQAERLLGYAPNLDSPESRKEKIIWLKIHDRNPLLPIIADKIRVRDFVRDRLGSLRSDALLIPLLYSTRNPITIPFNDLPANYIIKSNHGSGQNLIIKSGSPIDRLEIIRTCRKWLKRSFGVKKHEWHYQVIPREILIEELLMDEDGAIPPDYKLFFFNGTFQMLQIDFDRLQGHTRSIFDKDLHRLNARYNYPQSDRSVDFAPIPQMVEIGGILAKGFDLMRVDFYWHRGQVLFGEMTATPEAGYGKFDPKEVDFQLGTLLALTGHSSQKG